MNTISRSKVFSLILAVLVILLAMLGITSCQDTINSNEVVEFLNKENFPNSVFIDIAKNDTLNTIELGDQLFLYTKENYIGTDSLYYYSNKLIEYAELKQNHYLKVYILNDLGILEAQQNNIEGALKYFEDALEYSQKKRSNFNIALSLTNIATIKNLEGETYVALEKLNESTFFYQKVIEKCPEDPFCKKASNALTHAYISIALSHMLWSNYEEARSSLKKAESILKEYPHKIRSVYLNSAFADLELKLENYETSLKFINKTINERSNIFDDVHNHDLIAYYCKKVSVLTNLNQLDSAKYYLDKSVELSKFTNSQINYPLIWLEYGHLNLEKNNYKQAENYFQKSLTAMNESESFLNLNLVYRGLSLSYEGLGNYSEALKYQKLKETSGDSIFNQQKQDLIDRIESKFEYEQKLREKQLAIDLGEAKARNSRNVHWLLGIILLLLALSLFSVLRFNKRLNAQQNTLKLQGAKLQLVNQTLTEKNENLLLVNKSLESFTTMASHDLRSPLQSLVVASDFFYDKYVEKVDKKDILLLEQFKNRVQKLDRLIKDLFFFSSIDNRSNLSMEEIGLQEILDDVLENLSENIKEHSPEIIFPIKLPILYGNRNLMVQLFQNIISNSIKYSKENGRTRIELVIAQESTDQVIIELRDNGIGIDSAFLDKVLEPFNRFSKNQYSTQGLGMGLAICKKIVNFHKGKINVLSQANQGTTIILNLPKKPL